MALENITGRILKEAKKESEKVKKEAEKKAEAIVKEGEEEAASLKKKILSQAKVEGEAEKRRILSLANLERRNLILQEKEEQVAEIFEQALQKFLSLPQEKYKDFIKKRLLQETISGEEEVIVSPSDRKKITDGFLAKANEELEKQGKKGALRLSPETREIKGGFILRSDGIEINNSFPALLEAKKDELEPLILKLLLKE